MVGVKPAVMRDYLAKISLIGQRVRLEPLAQVHCDALAEAGTDPGVWHWLPNAHYAPGTMQAFVDEALTLHARRAALPFATVDMVSGAAVGSTRFHNIDANQRRLEIGVTWIAPSFQRSYVNTEAKLLQLWYAFDVLSCRRVEFKADAENLKSRNAILRLGAREEGIFRKHMLYGDGRNRDSVYFSIIDDEWAAVRSGLEARLGYQVIPRVKEG